MRKTWNKDEEEYLEKNYHALPNDVIAGVLKKSRQSITLKAFRMGLPKKDREAIEIKQPKKQIKYREETPLLADIICFYHRRNMNVGDIAKDVHCPPRQVREILERCMDNGMYERYAKAENSAIQFKPCREWIYPFRCGTSGTPSPTGWGGSEVQECEVI